MNSECTIYDTFITVLNQRLSYNRKTTQFSLSSFTHILIEILAISGESTFLRKLLDDSVGTFVLECEPMYDMSEKKLLDSLMELSLLSGVYSDNMESSVYTRIKKCIENVRKRLN